MSKETDQATFELLFLKLGIIGTISKYYGYFESTEKLMLTTNKTINMFWKKHRSGFVNLHSFVHPLRSDMIDILSDGGFSGNIGFDKSLVLHCVDNQINVEKLLNTGEEKGIDLNEKHFKPGNTELKELKIGVIDQLEFNCIEKFNGFYKLWIPKTLQHLYLGGGYYFPLDYFGDILPNLLPGVTDKIELVCFEIDGDEDLEVIFKYGYNAKNLVLYDFQLDQQSNILFEINPKEHHHEYKLESLCLKYTIESDEDNKLTKANLENLFKQFSKINAFKKLKCLGVQEDEFSTEWPNLSVYGAPDFLIEKCNHSDYNWETECDDND